MTISLGFRDKKYMDMLTSFAAMVTSVVTGQVDTVVGCLFRRRLWVLARQAQQFDYLGDTRQQQTAKLDVE